MKAAPFGDDLPTPHIRIVHSAVLVSAVDSPDVAHGVFDARPAIYLRRNRPDMLTHLAAQMQGFAGVMPVSIDARARLFPMTTPAALD